MHFCVLYTSVGDLCLVVVLLICISSFLFLVLKNLLNSPLISSMKWITEHVFVRFNYKMQSSHCFDRYYSMYGHVEKLAEEIKKGASSVEGVEAKLWQVPETLPEEVLGKMSAPPKSDVAVITPTELSEADGFVFGFPTRFGMMAAQFKAFLDATGGLWRTQQLAGKPAGLFYSTGSQGGGQETTALTAITQLVHHGMIFVPIGYTFGAGMFEMENVKGGSPYGAGTYAGDGSRQPSALELEQAFHQGKYIATITKKLKQAA